MCILDLTLYRICEVESLQQHLREEAGFASNYTLKLTAYTI